MIRAFIVAILMVSIFIDYQVINMHKYQSESIKISVTGEVSKPGVYTLARYSTIDDLLDIVDLNEDADLSTLNLTKTLKNGDAININSIKDKVLISINTGSVEQLDNLPGIGKSTAEKIIKYRDENGLFQNIEDLMLVEGIKSAKYEKIKDFICL